MLGHQTRESPSGARRERPQGFTNLLDGEVIADPGIGRGAEGLRGCGMQCLQGDLDVVWDREDSLGKDSGCLRQSSVADGTGSGAAHCLWEDV